MILEKGFWDTLPYDPRFNQWCKIVSPGDIDLSQAGGYMFQSDFTPFGSPVEIYDLHYLVYAAQTGSHRHHHYDTCLINAEGRDVSTGGLLSKIRAIRKTIPTIMTPAQYNCGSKGINSACALYIWTMGQLGNFIGELPLLIGATD